MAIEIRQFGPEDTVSLGYYQQIPMTVSIESVLEVSINFNGLSITETPADQPRTKDLWSGYYEIERLERFTCAHNSSFFIAMDNGQPVGGASGIRHCADAEYFCMTDGRDDIAVLRDIRVLPEFRRSGVGKVLFENVVDWAQQAGLGLLKIETQNNNLAACRFYQSMGARLGGIQRHAYGPPFEHEVMLLWYLEL